MSDNSSSSWDIFIDQYPQVMKLMRRLAKEDWFINDGWVVFIGHYAGGIFMQLYKSNWYNYSLDGIHFEFGLTDESLQRKQLTIDLHIEHRKCMPDRAQFNALTIPRMADIVRNWGEGVEFSDTNQSQRLSVTIPFTKTGFAQQVTDEFTRLSALGDVIDAGLRELWPAQQS